MNGYLAAAGGILAVLAGAWLIHLSILGSLAGGAALAGIALVLAGIFVCAGLYMLQPNETAVLTLFGRYVGTDRGEGLRWAFPLYRKRKLTVRARNLNMSTLKVNDKRGNPVELAAAVVWRVRDTAQALFEVDDFERYVSVQALSAELTARFEAAGVETLDAKLTHLAYAPEIAQVMLRRQQAQAIISARARIVHGAVTMVEDALKGLAEREIVELDAERKASMVSNLLVVLCSDRDAQPIINAGTLYN
jgi:regulator of protease activity HflC (stomatin/prohibitin superfamily)